MRIAVFGTGAVGGYFGGRLAIAGEDVIFIARGDHLQAMQKNGLRVDSIGGDFVVHPIQTTDNPTEVGEVDAVIVGVKAWQVSEAAEAMRPMVGPNTFVLPLQNGVEAPAELAAVLGAEHVLGGICRIFSSIAGPGHIRHAGAEPFVGIGATDNRLSESAERLCKTFVDAQINATIYSDIQVEIWKKFVFIASFSGIGAVTRVSAGVWRRVSEARQMYAKAVREVLAVARARKINVPDEDEEVARRMAALDNMKSDTTASMQRDHMEGRPSELEYQNGAVVRLGKEVGVETPLHKFIYHSLLPGEMNARERRQA
jgi:2-dehydropantoate 2-reductase